MKYIAIILLLILEFSNCCPSGRNLVPIPQDISDYTKPFELGNWWIYENTTHSIRDSFWLSYYSEHNNNNSNGKCTYTISSTWKIAAFSSKSIELYLISTDGFNYDFFGSLNGVGLYDNRLISPSSRRQFWTPSKDTILYFKPFIGIDSYKIGSDSFYLTNYNIL
jgi:hypothetical protein